MLINLCIYGSAVPNIFNGELEEKDEFGQVKEVTVFLFLIILIDSLGRIEQSKMCSK